MLRSLRTILVATACGMLQAGAVAQIYQTDFATGSGWTLDNAAGCNQGQAYGWAVDATPAAHFAGPFRSAPASLNFNDGVRVGPAFGSVTCGTATSPTIDLSGLQGNAFVRFWLSYDFNQGSGCVLDSVTLEVSSDGFQTLRLQECLVTPGQSARDWHVQRYDLQRSWGSVQLRFAFYGGPGVGFNDPSGPFIDDLVVDLVCPPQTTYCPSTPNSASTNGARIGVMGSTSVGANNLRLYATNTPPQTFAVGVYGSAQAMVPSGAGFLCVGGSLFRLPVAATGSSGTPTWSIDLTAPPAPSGLITAGSTWHFQTWFRDSPATWNFSDALTVVFCD